MVGNDTLIGGAGNDTLLGGAGNDRLVDGDGTDRFDGGTGTDTAVYASNTAAIKADLALGTVSFPGHSWPAETLVSIENIETGSGNDVVSGSGDANLLTGGAGNDTLIGGVGSDTLNGGDGNDVLAGGDWGNVSIYFDPSSSDGINNHPYQDGVDVINGGAGQDTVSWAQEMVWSLDYMYNAILDAPIHIDLGSGHAELNDGSYLKDTLRACLRRPMVAA